MTIEPAAWRVIVNGRLAKPSEYGGCRLGLCSSTNDVQVTWSDGKSRSVRFVKLPREEMRDNSSSPRMTPTGVSTGGGPWKAVPIPAG